MAHWWGVDVQTVWRWRKALGVSATTPGTSRLRSDYTKEPWAIEAQTAMNAKAGDPERREKVAAAKRGKPRPRHVVEAMRQARIGTHPSDEARRRMSEAHRVRGTRPPAAGRPWEPEEDALLGTMPDEEVAQRSAGVKTRAATQTPRSRDDTRARLPVGNQGGPARSLPALDLRRLAAREAGPGGSRAEFLRIQVDRTRLSWNDRRQVELCRREEALLAQWGQAWRGEWRDAGTFHKGLLVCKAARRTGWRRCWRVKGRRWHCGGSRCWRARRFGSRKIRPLLERGTSIRHFSTLDLGSNGIGAEEAAALAGSHPPPWPTSPSST